MLALLRVYKLATSDTRLSPTQISSHLWHYTMFQAHTIKNMGNKKSLGPVSFQGADATSKAGVGVLKALAAASHFGEQEAESPRLRSTAGRICRCMVGGRGLTEADQLSLFFSTAASSWDSRFTGSAVMGQISNCAESLARVSLSAALDSLRKAALPIVVVAKSIPH